MSAMETPDTITVDLETLEQPTDLRCLFNNDHPIELEIGCGKGGFLLQQAKAHADRNYFGIEWANKYYKYAADRMARWSMSNVRILRTDAKVFVMHRLKPACLSALHIYHPDPWPKKRHHKKRLIQKPFAQAAVIALMAGARWAIQTDHAEYFDQIQEVMASISELEPIPYDDADYGTAESQTGTNFETKYIREGREIYRLAFRRLP